MEPCWVHTSLSCTGVEHLRVFKDLALLLGPPLMPSHTPRVSLPYAGWSRTHSSLVSAGCLDHSSGLIPLDIALFSGICPLSTTLSLSRVCSSSLISIVNNQNLS